MTRIIYLCPFSPKEVTGGVKIAYRHVEFLTELGYDASVWQPEGPPIWLKSSAKRLPAGAIDSVTVDDVLVFPEVLHLPVLAKILGDKRKGRKICFVQNQYYVFNDWIPRLNYADIGIADVFCCSQTAKGFLERVLGLKDVAVVPCHVDGAKFFPRTKKKQIALVPRKMPQDAGVINYIFSAKYPHMKSYEWKVIAGLHEDTMAQILGASSALLSFSNKESFGLVPVEAMASGCAVVGYHGYGGLEYATPENGWWFSSDEHEAVADALYLALKGIEDQDPNILATIAAGRETAGRYSADAAKQALSAYYGGLFERFG